MRLLRQGGRMWSLTIFAVVAVVVLAACGREPGDVPTPTPADVEAPVATPEVEAPDTTPPAETVDVEATPEPEERIVIVTTPGPEEEATPEPEAPVEATPEEAETPEITIIVATDGTPVAEIVEEEITEEVEEDRDIIVIQTTPVDEEVAPEPATPEPIEEETAPPVIIVSVATPEPDEVDEQEATPEPLPEAEEEAREIIVIRTPPTPEATPEDGRITIVTEAENGREPVPATIVVADAEAADDGEAEIIVRAPTCPPGTVPTIDGTPIAGTPVATPVGNDDSTVVIECEPEP